MAKKRKTRHQKLISDLRHKDPIVKTPLSTTHSSETVYSPSLSHAASQLISEVRSPEYDSVSHDLRKTSAITGAIVIVELMLFFWLR